MTTGSSSTSSSASGGAISTFKGEERALRADRLGTGGLLLSVLAATAPLMVVAGVMPTTFAVMGIVGQPLLFVVLGVVLILFSIGYAEMSRHVHNAGAFYAYISRGLGGTAGAGAALVALVAYNALQVGIYGIFGFEVSGLLSTYADLDVAWWIPALLAVLAVGALGWLKIDVNARVLGVLLLIEVVLVVVFDIAAVTDPGAQGCRCTPSTRTPSAAPGWAPRSASASPPSSASSRRPCTPRRPAGPTCSFRVSCSWRSAASPSSSRSAAGP